MWGKPPEVTAKLIANLWLLHKWRTFVIKRVPQTLGGVSPQSDNDVEAVTQSAFSHLCLQRRL